MSTVFPAVVAPSASVPVGSKRLKIRFRVEGLYRVWGGWVNGLGLRVEG